MSGSSIGKLFVVTNFGESHGPAIGCVIDGCPPGMPLNEADIQPDLDRRRPGQSKFVTQRKEADAVKILSGVYEGVTTGTPIPLLIENTDRLMVTDQNHGYCVARDSVLPETAEILFSNINDRSVEGLRYKAFPGVGVQFTPSGDRDSSTSWIFDSFLETMKEVRA